MEGFITIKKQRKQIVGIVNEHWYSMHTSIHYARIVLDPKWKGKRQQFFLKT
jgi:hypothetical protein